MRQVSPGFKRYLLADVCEGIAIVLVTITHPSLAEPVRLSSDATERLSEDPLVYATKSRCEDGVTMQTYTHVLMTMLIPDDKEGEPLSAQLQLENVEYDAGPVIKPIIGDLKCSIRIVLKESPDHVEVKYLDLDVISANGLDGSVSLSAGRENTSFFTIPGDSMTRDRFPGLF